MLQWFNEAKSNLQPNPIVFMVSVQQEETPKRQADDFTQDKITWRGLQGKSSTSIYTPGFSSAVSIQTYETYDTHSGVRIPSCISL